MPKSTRQSTPEEGSDDDQLVMKVIAILNDSAVLNKMKMVLFPEKLSNEIRHLRETIMSFQKKLDEKSQHIVMLETKVSGLECKLDDIEQYGRRSNLIFSGFAELPQGEDLEGKLLDIVNNVMGVTPPLQPSDIERVHRLGRKTDTIRPRAVIARFVSGKTRDRVYRSRATLKTYNHSTDQHHKIFINEDLTAMRSNLAYATRTLKKSKRITDCWTFNGKIVIKDNASHIHEIRVPGDLDQYK